MTGAAATACRPAAHACGPPACSIQFGGGGIFGACKNIDISGTCVQAPLTCVLHMHARRPCECIASGDQRSSRLPPFLVTHAAEINGFVTVRGEPGELAADGSVARPARLTVELQAPGAHK